jgi:hypothetical protein
MGTTELLGTASPTLDSLVKIALDDVVVNGVVDGQRLSNLLEMIDAAFDLSAVLGSADAASSLIQGMRAGYLDSGTLVSIAAHTAFTSPSSITLEIAIPDTDTTSEVPSARVALGLTDADGNLVDKLIFTGRVDATSYSLAPVALTRFAAGSTVLDAVEDELHTPETTTGYIRSFVSSPDGQGNTDNTVLYIDEDGFWNIGVAHSPAFMPPAEDMQPVVIHDGDEWVRINDDTLEVSAISASVIRTGGVLSGFEIIVGDNYEDSMLFRIFTDLNGHILGADLLDDAEIVAIEEAHGDDIDDSGAIGDDHALLVESADGTISLMADGENELYIQTHQNGTPNSPIYLRFDGDYVESSVLEDGEMFAGIHAASPSGFVITVLLVDGSLAQFNVASNGNIVVAANETVEELDGTGLADLNLQPETHDETTLETGAGGADLTRDNDVPAAPGWTDGIKTDAIKTAVTTALGSGNKITHSEAVAIVDAAINSLASNTTPVGANIVADLRMIAARGDTLFSSPTLANEESGYLAYVFDKLANTSPANAHFTGGQTTQTNLGNLGATSPKSDLVKLRDKWLTGADLPNSATGGDSANPAAKPKVGVYKSFDNLPLVNATNNDPGFDLFDIQQGTAGDCYLLAAVAGVAMVADVAFNKMFVANGDRTWGVRFFDAQDKPHWVTVNDSLVVASQGSTAPLYAQVTTGELWVPLLEKAYAQANELGIFARGNDANAFFAIEGGLADPIAQLLGADAVRYAGTTNLPGVTTFSKISLLQPDTAVLQKYTDLINSGHFLWVGSDKDATDRDDQKTWVSGHALVAYDADPNSSNNTTVKVYNPWGPTNAEFGFVSPFDADLAAILQPNSGIDLWAKSTPILPV